MYRRKEDEELLSKQILNIMDEDSTPKRPPQRTSKKKRRKKKQKKLLRIMGFLMIVLFVLVAFVLGTRPGRQLLYRAVGNFIYSNMDNENDEGVNGKVEREHVGNSRGEEHVMNYLIFGIEEFGGARNTDTMMIVTLNAKSKSIKLTSLLRDTYVEIPGHKKNKLNAAYSKGGVDLLIETIELNHKIQIDGFASINFSNFEGIVNMLGGVTIELGEEEAAYLNKTNYISKKSNRNVKPGVNKLNGNQVMGYVRVRKVKTLGGAHSDYGRSVRQQRVLKAMFDSYVAPNNLLKLVSLTKDCLGFVSTNLTQRQIEKAIEIIVENKITKLETMRIPVDGMFESPKKYEGIGYPLVLNWDANRVELYKFIFEETEEQAKEAIKNIK